jgi:hypothetical protein
MRLLSLSLLLVLATASCSRSNKDEMTRYHEDGRAKPVVAVASMIDTTSFDANWSLSDELTTMVMDRIGQTGQIFVKASEEMPFTENPFSSNLDWMKREFHSQEFVVFLELVEHECVAAVKSKKNLPPQEVSTNLNMAVRVRVVDLRGMTPKIVLQEMVRDTYFIPKSLFPTDYTQVVWGTDEYRKSPMGIAHAGLVQEISSRVLDYILLAKSR